MANNLMFEVGVKEAGNQLTELENRLKKIVSTYGKLELKVQVDGLKAFTSALENIGQSKGLEALQKRIDVLQVTLANVGMSGAKSIQEFEAAVKTTSAVADQYTQRINKMTEARDRLTKGTESWNRIDAQLTNFQNDKQVLAIYAQEQVAIKNLEDAKTRLNNTNAQEAESYQKVITSIETLSNAANTLKTVLGSWDPNKGSIVQLVEQFEKLHKEIAAIASELKGIDPSKLNLSGLNINVGSIAGLGDLNSAIRGLEVSINDIIRLFSNLANAVKLQPLDDQMKALLERCERAEAKLREVGEAARYLNEQNGARTHQKSQNIAGIAGLNEENVEKVSNLFERYRKLLADVQNQSANLGSVQNVAEKLGLNPTIVDQAAKRFEALWKTIENSMVGMERYKGFPVLDMSSDQFAKLRAEFKALQSEYKLVTQEANNYNKATERNAKTQQRAQERIQNAAKRTSENLGTLTDRLDAKKLNFKGMDFTELDTAIGKIRAIKAELENFAATGRSSFGNTAKEIVQTMGLAGANEEARIAMANLTKGKKEAEKANQQLTDSEQRLANAIKSSTDSMKGQSQVLSDLKMMATQYLSVWGAQSFINNIIQTGGLLEQQRLSIGAILQNAGQATELFDKIKALAVQSPFGVVELDRMSKQLTAYGFEYKELYDWTKRLGDISAATGTGVDRLALALGHVRSEGALSGYTLRQFAMGNVPLLRMLSENLGISTKQVREKVRKKEVSYDDVMKVLRQLTDEGGMFYQAQETMSQALNAKFKNLHDAFDIMYNEIAESGVGDALKRLAEVLTAGAKDWGRYAKDIMGVVAVLGIAKTAMWAYNAANAAGLSTTMRSIAMASKQEQYNLKLAASYRTLTATEQQDLVAKNALVRSWYGMVAPMKLVTTHQLAVALSTKKLTSEELYRAVALRQLSRAKAEQVILDSKLSTALKGQYLLGLQNVKVLGRMRVAMIGFGNALKGVVSIARGFAPLLAISAVMDMFARVSEMKSQASEASSALAEKATSDLKVLNETFKELQSSGYFKKIQSIGQYIGGHRVEVRTIEFNDDVIRKQGQELTREIDELKSKLQDMSPMYEGDLVDIDKMDSQVEQFKALVNKLESIRHANDVTEAMSDVVTGANVDVAGKNDLSRMFGDTYTEDVKDYENRMKDLTRYVNSINEETINNIDKELDGQLTELQKKYSLDSKNSALGQLFATWSKKGMPDKYKSKAYVTELEEIFGKATSGGFLGIGRTLSEQYKQLEADTKVMAETMASIVKNQFEKDPEGAMYAVNNYIKKLMSMSRVTDPRVIQEATNMLLEETRKNLPRNMRGPVIDEMQRKMVMEQFMGLLGESITETTTPEQAEKALQKYSAIAIQWGEQMGFDMEKIGMANADAYRKGLQARLNQVALKIDWQKRASKVFEVNTVFKTNIDKNLDEFAKAVQKDLKEKQDYLTRNAKHLKALKLPIKIDMDILMNAKKLKDLIDRLSWKAFDMAVKGDAKGARALYSKIDDELKPFYNALVSIQEDKTWLKQEGFPETDPTKGKSKSGSQEDKEAKRLREIIKLYKDAYDWYTKYEKQIGEASALKKVQTQFKPLFDEFKEQFKQSLSLDSIPLYKENLEAILQEAEKLYKDPKHKNSYMVEAIKQIRDAINNVDFEELGRDQEKFSSDMKRQLDILTRKWDMFNSIVESTGNRMLAARIAGVNPNATAADLKRANVSSFAGVAIDFDRVLGMSDDEIDKYVENLGIAKANIKGVKDGLKEWKKAQEDLIKADVDSFGKMLGSLVDYQSQLVKITDEYKKQIDALERLRELGRQGKPGGITDAQYQRAANVANANLQRKTVEALPEYKMLMEGVKSMTDQTAQYVKAQLVNSLNAQLRSGAITAKEYADKIKEINKKLEELQKPRNDVFTYMSGGLNGIIQKRQEDGEDMVRQGAEMQQNAQRLIDDSFGENGSFDKFMDGIKQLQGGKDMVTAGEGMQTAAGKMATTVAIIDTIVHGIDDTIQGLNDAYGSITKMLDALGNESASDPRSGWGKVGTALSALSAGSSSATKAWDSLKNGNIGGVISGVIGSFTEPITVLAQAHDARRERQIEDLKREVSKIDNTLNLIKSLRERELGYDSGNLRRQLAAQYEGQEKYLDTILGKINLNKTATEMSEYYSRGGLEGSGYQQELNALKKQRELYQDMYEEEADKKKSSSEALEEYKQKMAELDMTIMNYAKDLANELWGIDLKGWADQIGDSLMTAFENGEDAAEAFKDTVQDIMRQVLRKMLTLGIIEPMMERLQKKLFGENGQGGIFDVNNPEGTIDAAMREVGAFFGDGGEGQQMIEATQSFYNKWEEFMRSKGLTLDESESSNSKASSIKSITEQTADLLSAYINSIRADLSVNRAMIAQYFPLYYSALTSGNRSLTNIESHTSAIMRSNEIIASKITSLDSSINGLKNKAWKVPMA